MEDRQTRVIEIYVRKSGDDGRLVSIRFDEETDLFPFLDAGFAIDGNSAIKEVTAQPGIPLTHALRDVERQAVVIARTQGCHIVFR